MQVQEDAKATVTMTKRHELLHVREGALALSPLLAIQTVIREITQNMASMKQGMSTFEQGADHLSKGDFKCTLLGMLQTLEHGHRNC